MLGNLAKFFDHTLLRADALQKDIQILCDEAILHGFYAVCVQPKFLNFVSTYFKNHVADNLSPLPITVVGFPLGSNITTTKLFETEDCLKNGAKEIDMVIDIGRAKDGDYNFVKNEILAIKEICDKTPLKVIVETSYFSEEELIQLTHCVVEGQADYIKTSTGFSARGASVNDIKIFQSVFTKLKNPPQIKASGGIKTLGECLNFIELGVTRIGSSRSAEIVQSL